MTSEQDTHALTMSTPTERELRFERTFDSPREQVWKAYTDPTLIAQWFGGGQRVETMDVRPGGTWKFVADRPGGPYTFGGEYLEVDPPKRIVQTMRNGWNGLTTTETVEFEDLGNGQTRLSLTSTFSTSGERDSAVTNGAEMGAKFQFGQLSRLLAGLSQSAT
jgi:uncharacterized protein YndB with AHSA1/START domain